VPLKMVLPGEQTGTIRLLQSNRAKQKENIKFYNYLLGLIFWYDIIVRLKHVLESTAAYI